MHGWICSYYSIVFILVLTLAKIEDMRENREKGGNTMECETCANYCYDEEYEEYQCDVNMDEDDLARFLSSKREACPYYRNGDEYQIVRKQM